MLAAHPDDDEDLLDQADEAERTGIARQPAQLDDQLVEVVGEILAQRLDVRLAVLAVGREHEVDLVVGGILEIDRRIIVIVEIVVELVDRSAGSGLESALCPRRPARTTRTPRRRTPT